MTLRIIFTSAVSVLLASCSAQPASEGAVGDIEAERIMDDIEARIEMPEGALPIGQYARSYFHRGETIRAIYARSDRDETKGRLWNPELATSLQGGGCSQVNVTYDIATQAVTAHCNGPK